MKQINTDPIMFSGMTDCLAIAVENAVCEWGDTLEEFLDKFIKSGYADNFSNQLPFMTTGRNGEELVVMVNEKIAGKKLPIRYGDPNGPLTEFYWIGYAMALFCAMSGIGIREIVKAIPAAEWLRLYLLFHEYGDELLFDKLAEIYERTPPC
jgi:hypothetical protein